MSGTPQLIVIGSLNTDLLVRVWALPGPGETVTGGVFEMAGGGKGDNQVAVASGANHALGAGEVERTFGELDLSQARCALLSLEVDDEVVVEGAERAAALAVTVVVNPAPARPLP